VILIHHNIFGPQQVYNDPYRNAVSMIINQMLNKKSPLIYGDGEQKRVFTPIQDLIPLFPALLLEPSLKNQILNTLFGGGGQIHTLTKIHERSEMTFGLASPDDLMHRILPHTFNGPETEEDLFSFGVSGEAQS